MARFTYAQFAVATAIRQRDVARRFCSKFAAIFGDKKTHMETGMPSSEILGEIKKRREIPNHTRDALSNQSSHSICLLFGAQPLLLSLLFEI